MRPPTTLYNKPRCPVCYHACYDAVVRASGAEPNGYPGAMHLRRMRQPWKNCFNNYCWHEFGYKWGLLDVVCECGTQISVLKWSSMFENKVIWGCWFALFTECKWAWIWKGFVLRIRLFICWLSIQKLSFCLLFLKGMFWKQTMFLKYWMEFYRCVSYLYVNNEIWY